MFLRSEPDWEVVEPLPYIGETSQFVIPYQPLAVSGSMLQTMCALASHQC